MASEYDGTVKLAATFDTSYIKKSASEIRKEMDKAFDATSSMKATKEVNNLRQSIRQVTLEYDALAKKAAELENTVSFTKEYDALWDRLVAIKQAMVDNRYELKELERAGITYGSKYNQVLASIKVGEEQIIQLEKQMAEMRDSGKAYVYGDETKEYEETIHKIDNLAGKMRILQQRTEEQESSQLKSNKGWKALGIVFNTLGKDISNLISKLKKLASHLLKAASSAITNGFKKLGSAVAGIGNQAKGSEFSFNKLLKTLLKYGVGIRSFFLLYRKVRAAVVDGIQEMAQAGGGLNPLAVTLREFQTSLQYLKNSLATAFAPIAEVILPLLTSMMDRLSQVIQYVGAFIKAVQGASTYMKAIRTPYKSKEENKAEKADIKAQNAANKKAAKEDLAQRKKEYKNQVAEYKAAQKARNKEIREAESSNKQINKNNAKVKKNTALRNLNTRAITSNTNALKKQKGELAGFDDLDVLGEATDDTDALQNLLAVPPELADSLNDFNDALDEIPELVQEVDEAFEESTIPTWISDLAQTIRDFIAQNDWYGLGEFIGEKLNGLMKIVDDWINDVLRPEGVKWAERIAEVLNGLVAGIDWVLLGQTLADGLNAVFDIFNTFLTTFDFLKFGQGIGAAIKSWFDHVEWDLIGQTFANKWNALFHTIEGIVTTPGIWQSIGLSIATFLKNAIETIDIDSLATVLIAVFNGIFDMLRTFLDQNPFQGLAVKIYSALNRMIHEIDWESAGKTLSDFVIQLLDVFMLVAEQTDWEGFGVAIGEFLSNVDWVGILTRVGTIIWQVVSGIIKGLLSTNGGKVFLAIIAGIEGLKLAVSLGTALLIPAISKILIGKLTTLLVGGMGGAAAEGAAALEAGVLTAEGSVAAGSAGILATLSGLVATATKVIGGFIAAVLTPQGLIVAAIAALITGVIVLIWNNWDYISDKLNSIAGWLGDLFSGMVEWFHNNFTMSIIDELKDMVNMGIQMVEDFVNGIIAGVNMAIYALNSLSFDVPDWIPLIGGQHLGFNIPYLNTISIPKLAQGAVIPPNKQFLAMLGDQTSGTNIEAPLDTIVDAFRQVVGNMQVQNTGYSEMKLDGQTFARLATPYIVSELGRRGYDVSVLEG